MKTIRAQLVGGPEDGTWVTLGHPLDVLVVPAAPARLPAYPEMLGLYPEQVSTRGHPTYRLAPRYREVEGCWTTVYDRYKFAGWT